MFTLWLDAPARGAARLRLQGHLDDDATYAVVGCARLARWLPEGVAVVAGLSTARELAERAGVGVRHPGALLTH